MIRMVNRAKERQAVPTICCGRDMASTMMLTIAGKT